MDDKYIEDIITLKSDMKHIRTDIHTMSTDLKAFIKTADAIYVRKEEFNLKLQQIHDTSKEQTKKNDQQDKSLKELTKTALHLTKEMATITAVVYLLYKGAGMP